MLSFFFEPVQMRRHRKASENAKSIREVAARDAGIECDILFRSTAQAGIIRDELGKVANSEKFSAAHLSGLEFIENCERFIHGFSVNLKEILDMPDSAEKFEKRTTLEIEARMAFLEIKTEARKLVSKAGVLVAEYRMAQRA